MTPIQIEWEGDPRPILVANVGPGTYWLSTPWFDTRRERLISMEDLEDCWPEEVKELADANV